MASVFAPFLDTDPADFERATAVTYLGFVNGTRAALRRMKPHDRGVVVQVGSALAFRGIPLQAAYCGSKHAMVGFTESVITELLHDKSKVRVSMVHMPALNTIQFNWVRTVLPHHPMPVAPIYQPEVGARAILHAAEHPRRSIWVGSSHRRHHPGQPDDPGAAGPLPRPDRGTTASRARRTPGPRSATTFTPPCPATTARTATSTTRAHDRSPELWASLHRCGLAAATAATVTAAGLVWRARRSPVAAPPDDVPGGRR